jgi:hypothetical protein
MTVRLMEDGLSFTNNPSLLWQVLLRLTLRSFIELLSWGLLSVEHYHLFTVLECWKKSATNA